jgi:hypothetical protein
MNSISFCGKQLVSCMLLIRHLNSDVPTRKRNYVRRESHLLGGQKTELSAVQLLISQRNSKTMPICVSAALKYERHAA